MHILSNTKTRLYRLLSFCFFAFSVSACGTTYVVPDISAGAQETAKAMFAEEAKIGVNDGYVVGSRAAARRYQRVISRIKPVAENFCRQQMATRRPNYDCDVKIIVDTKMKVKNAYQTKSRNGTPIIALTVPMLMDARNDDEIAFALSHEYGHHIATHLEKAEQQALVGAVLLGSLVAVSQGYANANDPYRNTSNDSLDIQNATALGYAVGNRAFSQSYELESDVIATHITRAAGYDPVKGARLFARPENVKSQSGKLSFWGTHPPDEKRLALIVQTNSEIDANRGLETR